MNKALKMNPPQLNLDEEFLRTAENGTFVSSKAFTMAVTSKKATFTMALGMDFRFCRGASMAFGWSAEGDFTVNIFENRESDHKPQRVRTDDPLCAVPSRALDAHLTEIQLPNGMTMDSLPIFRRRHPDKVNIQREGNVLLTFVGIRRPVDKTQ